jgi:hypothetical protein
VLDVLRTRIDHDDFDVAIFSLDAVAADRLRLLTEGRNGLRAGARRLRRGR